MQLGQWSCIHVLTTLSPNETHLNYSSLSTTWWITSSSLDWLTPKHFTSCSLHLMMEQKQSHLLSKRPTGRQREDKPWSRLTGSHPANCLHCENGTLHNCWAVGLFHLSLSLQRTVINVIHYPTVCISLHKDVMFHVFTTCHNAAHPLTREHLCSTLWYLCFHCADCRIQSHSGTHIQSPSHAELQKRHVAIMEIDPVILFHSCFLTPSLSVIIELPACPLGMATISHTRTHTHTHFVHRFQSSTYSRCA